MVSWLKRGSMSDKFFELVNRQPSIPDNSAHGEGIHGICARDVRILSPLVMVICFLVRTTRKPHFSKALTARWWLIPASLGMSDFYVPYFLFRGQQVHDMNIVLNGFLDILKGFFFRGPLRPAPWEAGHPNGISFIGFLDIYGISHVTSFFDWVCPKKSQRA